MFTPEPTILNAIVALKPNSRFSIEGITVDGISWHDGKPTNITNQQILDKQAELQADYDAKEYQRARSRPPQAGGYPTIEDQLDMLWHDKKNDTTTWQDAIQAIKDAHPK